MFMMSVREQESEQYFVKRDNTSRDSERELRASRMFYYRSRGDDLREFLGRCARHDGNQQDSF